MLLLIKDSIGLRFRVNGIEEYSCPQKELDNQRKAYVTVVSFSGTSIIPSNLR